MSEYYRSLNINDELQKTSLKLRVYNGLVDNKAEKDQLGDKINYGFTETYLVMKSDIFSTAHPWYECSGKG